ncbi:hypothetical protein GGS24DRAFT_477518 [Hypoxylon argillaceum]|nr:hypothetical protein GGS24DRAFT_477518 [Hypoxylon argillaceum]
MAAKKNPNAHPGITFGAKIETKAGCVTERFTAGNPRFLSFDMGSHFGNWIIARWCEGAVITFSIDYDSFWCEGWSTQEADLALFHLCQAADQYNLLRLGVTFKYVPPGSGPVVFQLRFHRFTPLIPGALAHSFSPITAVESKDSLPLYVFGAAFKAGSMAMTFMHELAHILGGRHPSAGVNEPSNPSVELGPTDNVSILATRCHPGTLFLHQNDIESLKMFYGLPEGSYIEGHPVYEVVPCPEYGMPAYPRRRTAP